MTIKELNKLHPEKYVMVTYEFGAPLYIAPVKNLRTQITTEKNQAEVWSYADTLSAMKLKMAKHETGYKELKYEMI